MYECMYVYMYECMYVYMYVCFLLFGGGGKIIFAVSNVRIYFWYCIL